MRLFALTYLFLLFGTTLNTTFNSLGQIPLLTVCEILANLEAYNGKSIIVIGRFTATEEGRWLSEDGCQKALKTDGFVWPNILWLEYNQPARKEAGDNLITDPAILKRKLRHVTAQTRLRGDSEAWAFVYGQIQTHNKLETVLAGDGRTVHGNGFGHLNAAPAQVVYSRGDLKILTPNDIRQITK